MQKNTVPHDVAWLGGWLACWLAWLAGLLMNYWRVGWLAGGLAGLRVGWLAGGLAGWKNFLGSIYRNVFEYVQKQSFSDTASRDYDTQGDMIFPSFLLLAGSS